MNSSSSETLVHPEHGELPAQRLLDCLFALTPNGRILHFHIEQVEINEADGRTSFKLTDREAEPERTRCQIIPPLVNSFTKHA